MAKKPEGTNFDQLLEELNGAKKGGAGSEAAAPLQKKSGFEASAKGKASASLHAHRKICRATTLQSSAHIDAIPGLIKRLRFFPS